MPKWYHELAVFERNKKNSLFYDYHYLIQYYLFYDLKFRPNKLQYIFQDDNIAAYYLNSDAKNFDRALEEQKAEDAISLGVDIEECKGRVHRVWKFIKPKLTIFKTKKPIDKNKIQPDVNQKFDYVYSEKSGKREATLTDNRDSKL